MASEPGTTDNAEAPALVFQITTLGGLSGPAVRVAATATVGELRAKVAQAMAADAGAQQLLCGSEQLTDDEACVLEACREAYDAAAAAGSPVQLTVVKILERVLSEESQAPKTFNANAHPRVFTAPEGVPTGVPTGGGYDHTSIHYWGNHSGGGSVVRLQLPETHVRIAEVRATVRAHDQGWGGTGSAGAVVVLLDAGGKELAYSLQSLHSHGEHTLEWVMTPEAHGGRFPAKTGEEAYGTVCGEGKGLALELRAFTPNWGGWSVTAVEGQLSATVFG